MITKLSVNCKLSNCNLSKVEQSQRQLYETFENDLIKLLCFKYFMFSSFYLANRCKKVYQSFNCAKKPVKTLISIIITFRVLK